MRLTPEELITVAAKVRDLSKVGGIKVRQIEVGRHLVFLDMSFNQREGDQYFIVGITDKIGPNTPHVTRGRGSDPSTGVTTDLR